MANDDPQTDLKKRARRRLVGAAALALLAIIVLPMIMDPEVEPAGDDIQVRIPSQEGGGTATRAIEPPVSTPVEPIERAEVVSREPPVVAPSPVEAPPEVAPQPPEPEAVASVPPPKPADEASRVKEILAGKAEASASAAAKAASASADAPAYVVQVGAFSNANNADAMSKKIREQGFDAYTRKIGSTTRVRVGPYPDRKSAESAAARLERQGFKGVVMQRG